MNIDAIIKHLFPGATQPTDFAVSDVGRGPFIAAWRLPDTQPTQAELEAAWPEAQKQIDIARIAATRYEHEIRGITYDTRFIATDRVSQSKLTAARIKGLEGVAPAAGWKCLDAEGALVWWKVTPEEMAAVADAAFDYIDQCFKREEELVIAVKDGTFNESMLTEGWPA